MQNTGTDILNINNLSFTYPNMPDPSLLNINLSVKPGELIVLCGSSGCGKTTLLRQIKQNIAAAGELSGEVLFEGVPLSRLDPRRNAAEIGFVQQNPDNQIVTETVWQELAFGLESLGVDSAAIRLRVSEMACFFGIEAWFRNSVAELSGGQKQILALASVMALQPSLLILDEPTSSLDPIAAEEFLSVIRKINRELGVTVILSEHRAEQALAFAERAIIMEEGRIICDGSVREVGEVLRLGSHSMFASMPLAMRVWAESKSDLPCPVTVREGRSFLSGLNIGTPVFEKPPERAKDITVRLDEVHFRYSKNSADILKGVSFSACRGEITAILGGNGAGKTTLLSIIAGLIRPWRGKLKVGLGQDERVCLLPQDPQTLFMEKTVKEELLQTCKRNFPASEVQNQLERVIGLGDLEKLLLNHPYDLSGGQQQRVAFCKVLLANPQVLLIDEPTKGMDAAYKAKFAKILRGLADKGMTIIMVSHDIEFCAEYTDKCALLFDGIIITENPPRAFFCGNSFYSTAANRMARHIIPCAVIAKDIISSISSGNASTPPTKPEDDDEHDDGNDNTDETNKEAFSISKPAKKALPGYIVSGFLILFLVPLCIISGFYFLGSGRYYFISLLVILLTLSAFAISFERRHIQLRELVIIAVLCAITVAGRTAFFMVPQYKPVIAIVIISGAALGSESGFLIGALSGFVSNMIFGQGPWTPWQMFALGIIGFISGLLFCNRKKGRYTILKLCLFGGPATFIIYGGIVNSSAVLVFENAFSLPMLISTILKGVGFDLIHSVATVLFLGLMAAPMLDKLYRVKTKYGLNFGKNS